MPFRSRAITAFSPGGSSGEGSATNTANASAPLPDTLAADAVPPTINNKSVSSAKRRMGTPGLDPDLAPRVSSAKRRMRDVGLHQATDTAST